MVKKDFVDDFYMLLEKLDKKEPFAFSRFSDGEVYIMQKKEILLGDNVAIVGDKKWGAHYSVDDRKHYDPATQESYRQLLEDSFMHFQDGYHKGISCSCCIGQKDWEWQMDLLGCLSLDSQLTWSNLLINANYLRYVSEMMPQFQDRKVVYIVNEHADLSSLPFTVAREFRIGSNCMVNDFYLLEEIDEWISKNKIDDHLFLFSAASLSNLLIHPLYKKYPSNTYMDIGSSLNPFMKGIKSFRDYMSQLYDVNVKYKKCIW